MNYNSFANRSRLALGALFSAAVLTSTAVAQPSAMANAAPAPAPVTVVNTSAQPVPITGYVAALTTADAQPVQINLTADFSYKDVAPKGTFTIPAGKQFNLEHINAYCTSNATMTQDFAVRLGTGAATPFAWFMVNGKQFIYPSFGITMFGSQSLPTRGTFDAGPIWVDGLRTENVGSTSYCTVVLLGNYTNVVARAAQP